MSRLTKSLRGVTLAGGGPAAYPSVFSKNRLLAFSR
jgi:hypothetical protein